MGAIGIVLFVLGSLFIRNPKPVERAAESFVSFMAAVLRSLADVGRIGHAWGGLRLRCPAHAVAWSSLGAEAARRTAGGGVEYAFSRHWSARLEYLYFGFESTNVQFPSPTQYAARIGMQSIRVGLNRKLGGFADIANIGVEGLADLESDRWEIRGQTPYLGQGYPSLPAP